MLISKSIGLFFIRFKKTKTDTNEVADKIKRLNYENKMAFGNLLESRSTRRKRSKQFSVESQNINSVNSVPKLKADVKATKNNHEIKSVKMISKITPHETVMEAKHKYSTLNIDEDLKMIHKVEKTRKMPDVVKINVSEPHNHRAAMKSFGHAKTYKGSNMNENNVGESSEIDKENTEPNNSIKNYNELHWNNNVKRSSLIDVTEETILKFPLININKEKCSVNTETELNSIKKINNYYPEYASVSVVLSGSMTENSEANLERWKQNLIAKLGPDGFKTYNKGQMDFGSSVRKKILDHLKGIPEEKLKITSEYKNIWRSVKPVFSLLSNTLESEGLVVHKHLKYKGLFDSLSLFRKEMMLINWKKSSKFVPSLERTYDMPLALAAYIGALNFDDRYPFRVEQGLLVMAYTNGQRADVFYLDYDKCLYYWQQWIERLNIYRLRLIESNMTFVPASLKNSTKLDIDNEFENMKKEMIEKLQSSTKELVDDQVVVKKDSAKIDVRKELQNREVDAKKPPEDQPEDGNFVINENLTLDCELINEEKSDYSSSEQTMPIILSKEFNECSYPSVTNILSETRSESAKFLLERWKRKMIAELGVEGFDEYQKNLLRMGTILHELIRKHLLDKETELPVPNNLAGCWQSLQPVFPLITKIHGVESHVVHPLLKYRGIIDCIAEFRNKLVIIDWKKSDKLKTTLDMMFDAPLQVAAYVGAVNFDKCFPYKIEEAMLIIAYSDGTKADILHISKEKCWQYWNKWLERLNKYQNMAYKDGSKIIY